MRTVGFEPTTFVDTIDPICALLTLMTKRTWTENQLIDAVAANETIAGVLRSLNLQPTGANYKTIHTQVRKLGLNTSHWKGQSHNKGKPANFSVKYQLCEILVDQSHYSNSHRLKLRLLKSGLLQNKCYICGINEWQGHTLTLQLDHINGCNSDNRQENLRLLCPNCHSQTATFAGKNIGRSHGSRTRNDTKVGAF